MSEMVERVARAIWEAREETFPPDIIRIKFDVLGEGTKSDHRAMAEAAIKAMRAPTDAMEFAGFRVNRWTNERGTVVGRVTIPATGAWQAMIDAALSDTTGEA